jgi:hypothetical protein
MKVFSLYYKDGSFLGAFPSRELAVNYGKMSCADEDAWDYDVIEEYLSKSPYNMFVGSPYTPLTPRQTIPCNTGITLIPDTPKTNPGTYPDIYCGVKANDL